MVYSKKLVDEYKELMLRDYDKQVTDEEAQLHLDSLSKLFLSFADIDSRK